jgi:hypothetical protein
MAAGVTRYLVAGLMVVLLALPSVAAHALDGAPATEARFVLPSWVLWGSGAAVVAASFLVVAAFLRRTPESAEPSKNEADLSLDVGWTWGRAFGLAVLVALVVWGFMGSNWPAAVVWIGMLGVLPLLSYTLGDVWPRIDPFRALAALWPSVVALLLLVAAEMQGGAWRQGPVLAALVCAYVVFTLAGMRIFGARQWLLQAEVFGVTLRWWSQTGARAGASWSRPGALLWRWPAASFSEVALILGLLLAVNYDGFLATDAGRRLLQALALRAGEAGALLLVLALGLALFSGVFAWCSARILRASEALEPWSQMAKAFAPSLLPIAVGYHAAHSLVPALLSLPTLVGAGDGWSLDDEVLPWISSLQIVLILAGHVLAVVAAHDIAVRSFPSRIQAVRSEVPLTLTMVFYTLVGLWILGNASVGASA